MPFSRTTPVFWGHANPGVHHGHAWRHNSQFLRNDREFHEFQMIRVVDRVRKQNIVSYRASHNLTTFCSKELLFVTPLQSSITCAISFPSYAGSSIHERRNSSFLSQNAVKIT